MTAIRIHKQLDSHVLDLPELQPLVGKKVQIIVLDESATSQPRSGAPEDASSQSGAKLTPEQAWAELQRSFDTYGREMGPRTWTGEDLYER